MRGSVKELIEDSPAFAKTPSKYCRTFGCKKKELEELQQYNLQVCDFCDRKFENRYDMFIHNADHIIIPLLKSIPINCIKCGLYCISAEHLEHHMSVKHKEWALSSDICEAKTKNILNEEFEATDTNSGDYKSDEYCTDGDETLDSLIRKEQQCLGTESILQNFVINCKVDVEKFDTPWLDEDNDIYTTTDNTGISEDKKNIVVKFKTSPHTSESDPIRLLVPEREEVVDKDNCKYYTSIHFEDLIRPGIFHCKLCCMRFPNRYEVITHETIHMDLSKAFSLKKKKKRHRREPLSNSLISDTCHRKSLRMHVEKDKQSHDIISVSTNKVTCSICSKGFKNMKGLKLHNRKCHGNPVGSQLREFCRICYVTSKAKDVDYRPNGSQKVEHRRKCQECGRRMKKAWTMKLARCSKPNMTVNPSRIVDRIQFEEGVANRNRRKPLPLTNSARLKLIQKRLKLINKYNALYFGFLFVFNKLDFVLWF